jgi:DnaJ-class molecular chaperone
MEHDGKNHYTVLGVPRTASPQEIHHAFRAQARRSHPDAAPGAAPEQFRRVVEAYEVLSDPSSRSRYDKSLQSAVRPRTDEHVTPEPLVPDPRFTALGFRPAHAQARFASPFELAEALFAEIDAYFDALLYR